MKTYMLAFIAPTLLVSHLSADDLPKNLRRTSAEILGTIESSNANDCVVRWFADPYSSLSPENKREYRWRVRVPNGSKANIVWAKGAIPKDGFPEDGRRMIPSKYPLPSTAGEIVIVIRARGGPKMDFEISVFPEFPVKIPSIRSTFVSDATWLPYWKDVEPTLVELDRKTETRLKPNGQQLLMKHFVNVNEVNTGYAVWLEFTGE